MQNFPYNGLEGLASFSYLICWRVAGKTQFAIGKSAFKAANEKWKASYSLNHGLVLRHLQLVELSFYGEEKTAPEMIQNWFIQVSFCLYLFFYIY